MEKKTIMSIFIALIMVSSVFGVVLNSSFSNTKIKYNNHVFVAQDGKYYTELNGKEIDFYNNPEVIENIELDENFVNVLKNTKMMYFTSDFNDSLVEEIAILGYDLTTNMFDTNYVYVQPSLTTNETDLPQITCQDATQTVPVIYVKSSNETSSSFENGCLIINLQSSFDVAQYRDRILYSFYGVI